ncbi:hypothetical protein ERJ75_001661200 [Trypanosoma vivax]|uniref:CULT domain-containing protein n=1 Tax=Trypanosoma vivax (strain Y486) TaxID=1055687 RepID=G0U8E2_TRYVY|nr:hypothetical protein ERJ75_001661200 [Trypanosoma vivax]CCC53866.1 conserved hypothetical protein [Trypanosoma vivax Y486]
MDRRAEADGAETNTDKIAVLLCGECRGPIAHYNEILGCRSDHVWAAQVFPYELDLFADHPSLWCYSATNPAQKRFDFLRCAPATVTKSRTVVLKGPWSVEHSFFVGYEWCFANCGVCSGFVGWGFRKMMDGPVSGSATCDSDDAGKSCNSTTDTNIVDTESRDTVDESGTSAREDDVSFICIIITRCVGRHDYPLSEYEALLRGNPSQRRARWRERQNSRRRLLTSVLDIASGAFGVLSFQRHAVGLLRELPWTLLTGDGNAESLSRQASVGSESVAEEEILDEESRTDGSSSSDSQQIIIDDSSEMELSFSDVGLALCSESTSSDTGTISSIDQ